MSTEIIKQINKLPVIVGVTGHRNVVKGDYHDVFNEIRKVLEEIAGLCKTKNAPSQASPIVLLTGLAQGADMLAAKVAREIQIPYVAVLPCELEQFKKSFDDEDALHQLDDYVANALDVIVVDDLENDFKNQPNQSKENYQYRQVGIYLVQHSSIIMALWDGKPTKSRFGCGTADVVQLAQDADRPVIWITCRRDGDGSEKNVTHRYLPPRNK